MDCEAVLSRLWEYLDRELGPEDSVSMGEHLVSCSSCYPAYCFDRAFLALLARQRDACSTPASLVLRVRALIN
jgi:anti-sigma factor (TIGR02949 family)